jgi:PAS domain S-box-containing protein
VDLSGTLLSVNPAFKKILGWTPEEMIGRSVLEFISLEDHPPMRDGALIAERYAAARMIVNRFVSKNGERRTIAWISVIEDGLIYSQGRDVTVETEQAAALRQAEDALRQSQKMEAVGQLTGGLAHDFNNLLTAIGGSLQLMQNRIEQGRTAEVGRYFAAAQSAVKRATALTHRLLAFSRRQTLDPKPVDVNRLLAEMEELIRRTVGPSIELAVVGAGDLWPTLVDANQLENGLLNLCINARDAMPDGGRITIATANERIDDRTARRRDLPPGEYLAVSVADTGTGMSPDVQEKAFDPFFTTKPLGLGTGLGLSMVYGFARQSGGQVRIRSEIDKGTTVSIYLPRYTGDTPTAEPASQAAAPNGARRGATVLVVDDEPTVRMLIKDVLLEDGYIVLEAENGQHGLAALTSKDRIDLLITDVGLPGGINGRQLADAARVARPALAVLFITGYAENAVVGNGHLEAGMAILTKPFAVESLTEKVAAMLSGRPQ